MAKTKKKKKRKSYEIKGYALGGVAGGMSIGRGGATTRAAQPGTTTIGAQPTAQPKAAGGGSLAEQSYQAYLRGEKNLPAGMSFAQYQGKYFGGGAPAGGGGAPGGSNLQALGQSLGTTPVSGDIRSSLMSQQLSGAPLAALNQIATTGLPTDVSGITQAAQMQGAQQFGSMSDQIAAQLAATGGLDSSARVAALARAAGDVSTNIGIEGLRAGVGAQEAAANRRLGVLDPAVAALGVSAESIGRLGGLEQQGFGNAISALGTSGNLALGQERLGLERELGMENLALERERMAFNQDLAEQQAALEEQRARQAMDLAKYNIGGGSYNIGGGAAPLALGGPTGGVRAPIAPSYYTPGGGINQVPTTQPGLPYTPYYGSAMGGRVPYKGYQFGGATVFDRSRQPGGLFMERPGFVNTTTGRPTTDSVPAMLTPGETVIPADDSQAIATGSMPRDEIIRRITAHTRREGGEPVAPAPSVPPEQEQMSAIDPQEFAALHTATFAGLPSPEEMQNARRRLSLLQSAFTLTNNPRGRENLAGMIAQQQQLVAGMDARAIEANKAFVEGQNQLIERKRRAALDAEAIRARGVQERQTQEGLGLERERIDVAREGIASREEMTPQQQAVSILLDPNASPEDQKRAATALGRELEGQDVPDALRWAVSVLASPKLTAEEKRRILQEANISSTVRGGGVFSQSTIELTPGQFGDRIMQPAGRGQVSLPPELVQQFRDSMIQSFRQEGGR